MPCSKVPTSFALILAATQLNAGRSKELQPIKQWADFGSGPGITDRCVRTGERTDCGLSEKEAAFLATNYDIISFEKCFGSGSKHYNSTVTSAVASARQVKRQKGSKVKVLMYMHADMIWNGCYEWEFGGDIMAHPDYWLKNDQGKPYMIPGHRPHVDFGNGAAVEWWITKILKVYFFAAGDIDGFFFDASTDYAYFLPFAQSRKNALNTAHYFALKRAAAALKAVNPSLLLVGNSLTMDRDSNGIAQLKDGILDGVCAEHFGAFEWVGAAGLPVTSVITRWIAVLQQAAAIPGKLVFLKAWVGPETTPLDVNGPNWPPGFLDPKTHKPLVRTNAGIAKAAADMVDYAFATFLCVAEPNFYFSYGWWYDISQGDVPGEEAPKNWYPLLKRPVGVPLAKAHIQAKLGGGLFCTRSWEGVSVFVDLHNWSSAVFHWKEPEKNIVE